MSEGANYRAIIPRSRYWWLGLGSILLLACWLYLRGIHLSLPYLVHTDEPIHLRAAQFEIEFGHFRDLPTDSHPEGYPPGIVTLNYLFLKHIKPAEADPATILPALRLISIAAWMLVIVIIALLGEMIARPLTGLMAATIWVVNPWVVQRAHFALPDGYLTLFTLLALWLALVGYRQRRRSFSTAAVYSIMLATIFKTQALLVAPIVLLLPLLNMWRIPGWRQEAMQQTVWNMLRFSIFLFWLLLIYPTLEVEGLPNFPVSSYRNLALPSLESAWISLQKVLLTFQPLAIWLLIALVGLLLVRYRRRIANEALISLVIAGLAWLLGLSVFEEQSIRQYFVLGAILALLYSVSLTGLFYQVEEALTRLSLQSQRFHNLRSLFPFSLVTALLALSLLPSFRESDALAHNFTLHDRRNDLMTYMDTSLPPGKYISDHDGRFHKVMNRLWGGYRGLHDYPLARKVKGLHVRPLDEWRDHDAIYAIVPYRAVNGKPFLQFPEETFALKHYPPDSNYRDPGMTVLRLYPMQHKADAQLGSIQLLGFDLNASEVAAGEDIVFRHYWRAESPTRVDHHVYNHLLDEAGAIVAQFDYIPLWDGRRPTTTWDDPDEVLLGREFDIRLPPDLPPGRYQLISGLYDPLTSQRLTSAEWLDHIHIADIIVTRPDVQAKLDNDS